jgi:hypothetical protein
MQHILELAENISKDYTIFANNLIVPYYKFDANKTFNVDILPDVMNIYKLNKINICDRIDTNTNICSKQEILALVKYVKLCTELYNNDTSYCDDLPKFLRVFKTTHISIEPIYQTRYIPLEFSAIIILVNCTLTIGDEVIQNGTIYKPTSFNALCKPCNEDSFVIHISRR